MGRLTSSYGRRWGRLHAGIDLASGIGSPVRAVAAGVVQSSGTESGYGQAVRIRHDDGTVTVYAHMSALLVSTGEQVSPGEQIGREGNTGHSTGPHLHFEVRVNGSPIDPIPWLRERGIDV
ncbi:MAG: M23 family metallopeptidase [Frankiales bacterium]|nr:M23 family metallopeptidase [Frankiales bacterium]